MKKIRNRASKAGTVMEKIAQDRMAELDKLRVQAEIDEVKAKMAESQQKTRQATQGGQQQGRPNYLQTLFVGKTPEQINQILEKLTPEKVQMLQLMSADPNQAATLTQLIGKQTSVNDTIQLIKLITDMNNPRNQGFTMQGMAALIKALKGEEKGSSMKDAIALVKPIYEAIGQGNSKAYELHIKRLEERVKSTPSMAEQIQHTKALATSLGLTSTNKQPEFDLKLEDMRQGHDLDMERIRWEQQKYMLESEKERDKWGAIQQTFAPILQMNAPAIREGVKGLARTVGQSFTGQPEQPANPNAPPQQQIASFECPKCKAQLNVPIPPNAPEEVPIKCPKCGTVTPANLGEGGTTPSQRKPPAEEPANQGSLRAKYS